MAQVVSENGMHPGKGEPSLRQPRLRWFDEWYEFTQSTTLHGLNKVTSETPFVVRKLMWLCLVLCGVGLFVFQVVDRVNYFYSHPTTVNLEIFHNSTVQFPAVTICNQNSFRLSEAYDLELYHFLEELHAEAETQEDKLAILAEFPEQANMSKADIYLKLAHRIDDFIVSCGWGSHECHNHDMAVELTDHGVCYTFNQDAHFEIGQTGAEDGLNLYLNVERYEYMPGPHNVAGLKILLADRTEVPMVSDLGQAIPIGSHAFVGVKVVEMINLPEPYGDCKKDMSLSLYDESYTYTRCWTECRTNTTVSNCGCKDAYMPGNAKVCSMFEYIDCVIPSYDTVLDSSLCDCPVPCKSMEYESDISYATMSSRNSENFLEGEVAAKIAGKYVKAREILHRVDHHIAHEDHEMAEHFNDTYRTLLYGLEQIRDICSESMLQADSFKTDIENRTWFHSEKALEGVKYNIHHDFIRGFEVMDERTLAHTTTGFYQFLDDFQATLNILTSPEVSNSTREIWYVGTKREIESRRRNMLRALDNYTLLNDAYANGTQILTYKHSYDRRYDKTWISVELLSHSDKQEGYFEQLMIRFGRMMTSLDGLEDFLDEAYTSGSYNSTLLSEASDLYGSGCRGYNFYRYLLKDRIIYVPEELIDSRIEHFKNLNHKMDSVISEMHMTVQTIHASVAAYSLQHITHIHASLQRLEDYISNVTVSKRSVADLVISEKTESDIQATLNLFKDLRLRANYMNDLWLQLEAAYKDIWIAMLNESTTLNFYSAISNDFHNYTHITNVTEEKKIFSLYFAYFFSDIKSYELREIDDQIVKSMINADFPQMNVSEKLVDIHDVFVEYASTFNILGYINAIDGPLVQVIRDLQSSLQTFLDSLKVDGQFIGDNFVSLSVFMQQLSYERVDQQKSYDVIALLSDIGGSMGLFIGASLLTMFELLDVFIHTLARKLLIKK